MCCIQTVYKTEYSMTQTLKILSWKIKSCTTGSCNLCLWKILSFTYLQCIFTSLSLASLRPPADPDNDDADGGHHHQVVVREKSPAQDLRAALHVGAATDHHHPAGGGLRQTHPLSLTQTDTVTSSVSALQWLNEHNFDKTEHRLHVQGGLKNFTVCWLI